MKYVVFEKPSSDYSDAGTIYSRYGKRNATSFTRSELDDYKFYYGDSDYGDYDLDELSFVADKSFSGSIEITFKAYGGKNNKTSDSVTGTLKITSSKSGSSKGDITYTVKAGEEVAFDDDDFEDDDFEEVTSRMKTNPIVSEKVYKDATGWSISQWYFLRKFMIMAEQENKKKARARYS